jgi:Tfp pilus assembly protein PilE
MIVIAIIGLLATIAVPAFIRMRQRAKIAEAKSIIGAVRVSENAYYAEYSVYVGNQAYTPDRTADPPARFPWDNNTRFSLLGFAPEGRLYFSYALGGVDLPADGFTVQATCDLDGDGLWAVWTMTKTDKELVHSGADL